MCVYFTCLTLFCVACCTIHPLRWTILIYTLYYICVFAFNFLLLPLTFIQSSETNGLSLCSQSMHSGTGDWQNLFIGWLIGSKWPFGLYSESDNTSQCSGRLLPIIYVISLYIIHSKCLSEMRRKFWRQLPKLFVIFIYRVSS